MIVSSTLGYIMECVYQNDPNFGFGCNVRSFKNEFLDDCYLSQVEGQLDIVKNNDDVKFLNITSKNLRNFPIGLEIFFPNLEIIILSCAKLKQITHENLKPFGNKLKYLALSESAIVSIEGNLFKSTPKIFFLQIESRNLENINKNVFEPIKLSLKVLKVHLPCVGFLHEDENEDILNLIKEIKNSCYHPHYSSQNFTKQCKTTFSDHEQRIGINIFSKKMQLFCITLFSFLLLSVIILLIIYIKLKNKL